MKVPRLVQEQMDEGRMEVQKEGRASEGTNGWTEREEEEEEEANLVIDSPAFYGSPPARVVTVAIAITPRDSGCWLQDVRRASERCS